jgi:hypothetical protein
MSERKPQTSPVAHLCPACHFPQTKVQRQLQDGRYGATNYVCARSTDCALGLNLSKVDNWVAV